MNYLNKSIILIPLLLIACSSADLQRSVDLLAEFQPKPLSRSEVKATRYYDDIINRYNKIPLVNRISPDLDAYATNRAIDGLFLLVAREEANIRANPVARSTDLLKRVFGSLDG